VLVKILKMLKINYKNTYYIIQIKINGKETKNQKKKSIKNIFNHTCGRNRLLAVLSLLKWEGKCLYNVVLTKKYSGTNVYLK
jgi:hypothetical protein